MKFFEGFSNFIKDLYTNAKSPFLMFLGAIALSVYMSFVPVQLIPAQVVPLFLAVLFIQEAAVRLYRRNYERHIKMMTEAFEKVSTNYQNHLKADTERLANEIGLRAEEIQRMARDAETKAEVH